MKSIQNAYKFSKNKLSENINISGTELIRNPLFN